MSVTEHQFDAAADVIPGLSVLEIAARMLTEQLDPDAVPGCMVVPTIERLDRLCRVLTAQRTVMARRLEEVKAWEGTPHQNAAEMLASVTGSSISSARTELA